MAITRCRLNDELREATSPNFLMAIGKAVFEADLSFYIQISKAPHVVVKLTLNARVVHKIYFWMRGIWSCDFKF